MAKFGFVKVLALGVVALCALGAVAAAQTTPMTPEQQNALYEAQIRKARADAQAAENAARPKMPDTGIAGDVAVKGAGQVEGAALSAASIVEAARCIASRFAQGGAIGSAGRNCLNHRDARVSLSRPNETTTNPTAIQLLIVTGAAPLDLTAGHSFRTRRDTVGTALQQSHLAFCASHSSHEICMREMSIMGSAALSEAIGLMSLLRSDYEFGSIAITGQDDDMLVTAIMGEVVDLPNVTLVEARPRANDEAIEEVRESFLALANIHDRAKSEIEVVKAAVKAIRDQYPETMSPTQAAEYSRRTQNLVALQAQIQAAITQFDDLKKGLFEPSAEATTNLAAVLRALSILHMAEAGNGVVLWAHINNVAGSYYSQTNIWTWVGADPMHYSGGTVVTYRVSRLSDGVFLEAGVLPVSTGYVTASEVTNRVARSFDDNPSARRAHRRAHK